MHWHNAFYFPHCHKAFHFPHFMHCQSPHKHFIFRTSTCILFSPLRALSECMHPYKAGRWCLSSHAAPESFSKLFARLSAPLTHARQSKQACSSRRLRCLSVTQPLNLFPNCLLDSCLCPLTHAGQSRRACSSRRLRCLSSHTTPEYFHFFSFVCSILLSVPLTHAGQSRRACSSRRPRCLSSHTTPFFSIVCSIFVCAPYPCRAKQAGVLLMATEVFIKPHNP